jgi:hypothetical protein
MYVEKSYTVPCFKVLPLVYSDAISYYEQVCELREKVNEVIEQLNEFNSEVLASANSYTDYQIEEAKKLLRSEFAISLKEVTDKWGSEIDDFEKKVDSEITAFAKQVVLLNNSVSALYDSFDAYKNSMDSNFEMLTTQLYEYIDEHITQIDRLYVINPTNNKYEGIQKTLDDMYNFLNIGALTASEYDSMMLSANEYDKFGITAFIYDTKARFTFIVNLYLRMFSPFTGMATSIDSIIYSLTDLHKTDTLTAMQYDTKAIQADTYDSDAITAYNYDWNGLSILA